MCFRLLSLKKIVIAFLKSFCLCLIISALVFVYDYHPGSETLLNKHFCQDQLNGYSDPFASDPSAPRPYSHTKNNILRHQQSHKLPEPLIWNYIIQLTSALRLIHSSGKKKNCSIYYNEDLHYSDE